MSKITQQLSRAFNVQSAFFVPLWRRVLVVGFSGIWALVEFWNGAPFWALLFVAISIYCAHQFFIAFNPTNRKD